TIWSIAGVGVLAVVALAVVVEPEDEKSPPPATAGTMPVGKAVFAEAGCGSCHTLADADATGTVGPNLDERRPSRARVATLVTNGSGVMPSFRDRLTPEQSEEGAVYVSAVTRARD